MTKKWTKLAPTISRPQIHHEEIIWPPCKMVDHVALMGLVPFEEDLFMPDRAAHAVDPLSHLCLLVPEMANDAINPRLRIATSEDKLASRKAQVHLPEDDWPGIVLKSVVIFRRPTGKCHHIHGDVRIPNAHDAGYLIAKNRERCPKTSGSRLVKADAEHLRRIQGLAISGVHQPIPSLL